MSAPPLCRRRWAEQRLTVLIISEDDSGNRTAPRAERAIDIARLREQLQKELREQREGRRSSNPHRNTRALLGSALR